MLCQKVLLHITGLLPSMSVCRCCWRWWNVCASTSPSHTRSILQGSAAENHRSEEPNQQWVSLWTIREPRSHPTSKLQCQIAAEDVKSSKQTVRLLMGEDEDIWIVSCVSTFSTINAFIGTFAIVIGTFGIVFGIFGTYHRSSNKPLGFYFFNLSKTGKNLNFFTQNRK